MPGSHTKESSILDKELSSDETLLTKIMAVTPVTLFITKLGVVAADSQHPLIRCKPQHCYAAISSQIKPSTLEGSLLRRKLNKILERYDSFFHTVRMMFLRD